MLWRIAQPSCHHRPELQSVRLTLGALVEEVSHPQLKLQQVVLKKVCLLIVELKQVLKVVALKQVHQSVEMVSRFVAVHQVEMASSVALESWILFYVASALAH